jgi:hypothetical protein
VQVVGVAGQQQLLHLLASLTPAFNCTPHCLQDKKCFDSADWALAKEGKKQAQIECLATAVAVPDVHHNAKHTGSHLKPSS